ncbi:MAG: SPASM domain-containing protein [Bacteroidales bacterium]|nr:SPASM domain-containing protein [Bacteroidales bacterium]
MIKERVEEWKEKYSLKIVLFEAFMALSIEERKKIFPTRAECTGNVSEFFVLPDGLVTICEQMYRHPFFILGDLSKQSIMEMWNSPKALALWNFSQDEVREQSACKTCELFEECRRDLGSCWRMVVNVFGDENYDYPDINCPRAPQVPNDILIS